MFIVCAKNTKEFILSGNTLVYQDNGYPLLTEEKTAFYPEAVEVYEIESLPKEAVPHKYCYTTEKGFYLNPNYEQSESQIVSKEEQEKIEQAYREKLVKEVSEYGYNA